MDDMINEYSNLFSSCPGTSGFGLWVETEATSNRICSLWQPYALGLSFMTECNGTSCHVKSSSFNSRKYPSRHLKMQNGLAYRCLHMSDVNIPHIYSSFIEDIVWNDGIECCPSLSSTVHSCSWSWNFCDSFECIIL